MIIAPGDYDGDGKFDYRRSASRRDVRPTQSTFFIAQKSTDSGLIAIPWGLSNDLVVPGDYDGDDKTDLRLFVKARQQIRPDLVYSQKQRRRIGCRSRSESADNDLLAQDDYDGDGKSDIGVWRDTNGNFYVLRSSNGSVQTPSGEFRTIFRLPVMIHINCLA